MGVATTDQRKKNVSSPNAQYASLHSMWRRNRAICGGEQRTKAFDAGVSMDNMLIPFSPGMRADQYQFYKAEAELPGILSQFSKMLVGGLLRKKPVLDFGKRDVPDEVSDWLFNSFSKDGTGIVSFLDEALYEELQTGHNWLYVDYPAVVEPEKLSSEDFKRYKPFVTLWKAENVINWHTTQNAFGDSILKRVIVRGQYERFADNEFHPELVERIWVHELDDAGLYQIRVFDKTSPDSQEVVNGRLVQKAQEETIELVETVSNIMCNGKRLDVLPIWPLNGTVEPKEPLLSQLVDKEIALYNKVSRRNHLLYGAATYTPVISSDMTDDQFDEIVEAGLGSWIKLDREGKADVLKTPTDALKDMDRAIDSGIEEMAKLGIRMLSPESAQSGVALEIRNAAQNAQLGSMNTKVSVTMSKVMAFMVNWRYDLDLKPSEISFTLSTDFNPVPLGADWLRLATEWYENGILPRSTWLQLLRHNDMLDPEYKDDEGITEINDDELVNRTDDSDYADKFE